MVADRQTNAAENGRTAGRTKIQRPRTHRGSETAGEVTQVVKRKRNAETVSRQAGKVAERTVQV